MRRLIDPLAAPIMGILVLALGWSWGRAINPGALGFPLDDAWIHMTYGRGLLENGYLAYNPGVPATGCTSPLWAICLAALHAIFGGNVDGLVRSVVVVGSALHVSAIVFAGRLALAISGDRGAAILTGSVVALSTQVALAAFSGMEVSLAILLALASLDALVRRAWLRAGVLLALLGLTRPEAGVITIVGVVFALLPGVRQSDRPLGVLARTLVPSIVAAGLLVAYNLWASGAPLPATHYAKSAGSWGELGPRTLIAAREIIGRVPPFWGLVGWFACVGLAFGGLRDPRRFLPLLAGVGYALANLFVIKPIDPPAFYHVRYLLPAVPLLAVGATLGVHFAARKAKPPVRLGVSIAFLLFAAYGTSQTLPRASRHFHNDVRNINEVQRVIGEWLAARVPPDDSIAASDAGAIRYFSKRATVDVIGLNTPQMRALDEEFLEAHPVSALTLIPAWFTPRDPQELRPAFRATTEDYTVTSSPEMASQIVLVPTSTGQEKVRVRFVGFHEFAIDIVPGRVRTTGAP